MEYKEKSTKEKSTPCKEAVCCQGRETVRSDEYKKALINRLSRIEGQIRGIKAMVEDDVYCADILVQSSAAASAFNSFNRELLSSHLHSCVKNDIKEGHDEAIDEFVGLMTKLMK